MNLSLVFKVFKDDFHIFDVNFQVLRKYFNGEL